MPCNNCAFLIATGHDNTLCSLVGRHNTLQRRDTFPHRMFTDNELIKKKDNFDLIEDDDDIDWKYNPFDVDSTDEVIETPEQLISQITFEGSPQLQESQATEWSQVHLVPKPTPEGQPQKWRFTLDFVRLNSVTGGLEGWPIPNIQQIINRIGTLKPKLILCRLSSDTFAS